MSRRVPRGVPLSADLRRWILRTDDPSVKYRVLRELLNRPEGDREVVVARKQIGRTGWAAELLALQLPGGQWATPASTGRDMEGPKYIATRYVLHVLADLGMDRSDPRGRVRPDSTSTESLAPASTRWGEGTARSAAPEGTFE